MSGRHDREAAVHPARLALAAALGPRPDARLVAAIAGKAGVPMRQVRDAAAGRAVSADAFLAIAWAVGCDPATGRPARAGGRLAAARRPGRFVWWLVQGNVTLWRAARGLSLRAAAAEIGVSYATLDRAERGDALSTDSLLKIAAWLGMPPAHLTDAAPCFRVGPARRGPRGSAVTPPVSRETAGRGPIVAEVAR